LSNRSAALSPLSLSASAGTSAGGALIAIHALDPGATGFFGAVALGFCAYAALTAWAVLTVKNPPDAVPTERPHHQSTTGSSHVRISPIYLAGR
jgi:hypothetical protein